MAKKQQYPSLEEFLEFVPVFSKLNTWELNEEGFVVIHRVNRGFGAKFAQKFMRAPQISRIKLEEIGSFLIQHMDGQRTVRELADLVGEEFGEKAEPLYERLAEYMRSLRNNDFIYYKDREPEPKP